MGSMPGWFAKPPEFWQFDEYFGVGPELRERLEYLARMDPDKSSDYDKFWAMGSGLDNAQDHFERHWLGNAREGESDDEAERKGREFFPGIPKGDFLKMLRTAFKKAAERALDVPPGCEPKPLALVWNCAPGIGFLGVGVAAGPESVLIALHTPPYGLTTDEEPGEHVPDQAWSWIIPRDGDGSMVDTSHGVQFRYDTKQFADLFGQYTGAEGSPESVAYKAN